METTRHFHLKEAEEMEAVKRENEELKDVLSAVQLDLEAKTEVGRGRVRGGRKREHSKHLPCCYSVGGSASCDADGGIGGAA